MARRNYMTEIGCIACEDLTEFGAGKEGWLIDNPNLLVALDTNSIALSVRYHILVLRFSNGGADPSKPLAKIRPDLNAIEAEYISAIEWLVFGDDRALAIGTSCGYLMIFSLRGDLIHKQLVYRGRILRLRVRGTKKDMNEDVASEVCVVIPGVIGRFDGSDLQTMLQNWLLEKGGQTWDRKAPPDESGHAYARLPYQLWNVNKYGSCSDAAITGIMPPPLMELQLLLLLGSQVNIIILLSLLEMMPLFQLIDFLRTEASPWLELFYLKLFLQHFQQ